MVRLVDGALRVKDTWCSIGSLQAEQPNNFREARHDGLNCNSKLKNAAVITEY
jgi:hypothetical protein